MSMFLSLLNAKFLNNKMSTQINETEWLNIIQLKSFVNPSELQALFILKTSLMGDLERMYKCIRM